MGSGSHLTSGYPQVKLYLLLYTNKNKFSAFIQIIQGIYLSIRTYVYVVQQGFEYEYFQNLICPTSTYLAKSVEFY